MGWCRVGVMIVLLSLSLHGRVSNIERERSVEYESLLYCKIFC
jgi:hypothetical protein